ncbi:adenosylhomocysteinase [Kribbella sp. NPDC050124]|uniref:adenosylhomocysteinase n=1 Tax=Kribbella sp. NPDC050124 TaxID=3364114 RepID=UPI0037B45F62
MTLPDHESPATGGQRRIDWAARGMPALRAVGQRLAAEGSLEGLRAGLSLVLEPKTANLALALQAAGVEVSVFGHTQTTEVVDALRDRGVAVYAVHDRDERRRREVERDFLHQGLQVLVDDGATLIRRVHREFPELLTDLYGACEETTSGVRPLRQMAAEKALRIPVIAVNDAQLKYLFDNVYGTGQSCVMALLDLTNLQLAGRIVVVVGYGWVGKGVALHAAALGARVVVSEIDPIRALQAHHDGHQVASIADVASSAEVVFSATGIAGSVTAEHIEAMRDGVIVCTAGGGSFELPMDYLRRTGKRSALLPGLAEYQLPSGKRVLIASEGACVNCADAEGNPIEVMDLSLTLQALAIEHLSLTAKDWAPEVYPVPPKLEAAVARLCLDHVGATLEPVTPELSAAMRRW